MHAPITEVDTKKGVVRSSDIDSLNDKAYSLRNDASSEAEQIAEKALYLSGQIGYHKGMIESLCVLSWRNYRKGKYIVSLEHAQRAYKLAEEAGESSLAARALGNAGLVYYITGDYARALECHMRSLAIKEETDDKNGLANVLNNIGLVYNSISEHDKAVEYYTRSLALCEETDDLNGVATVLMNIATQFGRTNEYEKTLENCNRSLALYEELADKRGASLALNNIAVTYLQLREADKALEHHIRALSLREEIADKPGIAHSLINIGLLLGSPDYIGYDAHESIRYFARALSIAEEVGSKDIMIEAHNSFAKIYEQIEDWCSFAFHFKKYHEIEKEVYNEQTTKQIYSLGLQKQISDIEKAREAEHEKHAITEKLLKRILPYSVAERIKSGEAKIADKVPSATVLFADIVGFTRLTARLGSGQVVDILSQIFSHFDSLCKEHECEKIKTIGDSFMAASGVPIECEHHTERIARLALAIQKDIRLNIDFTIPELSIRIGIHTGEVIAGVLGTEKLSYDIWGDTVNTAARMESHGEPDMIHCTEEVFKALKDKFVFKERGEMEIKGKGMMKTFFLLKEK